MKIVLDAMGGDHAPEAPVLGAVQAAQKFGAQITLVGQGEKILEVLRANNISDLPEGVEISHADEVVDMHDDPANVIRKKKNSSMVLGLKMVADGFGDAFVCRADSRGVRRGGARYGKYVRLRAAGILGVAAGRCARIRGRADH